ncbi:MAG: ABC transporter permease [Rhodovulum sulfidophilum]|uniref:ABC transporter permease n=1 Tax=Rhodovulum sulfidophilum TaxID=35806 RepID=A0A2W5Q9B6_RHOSU|nr:MAG: ABC transporter permease [Rhodovulum sulfidophilum]
MAAAEIDAARVPARPRGLVFAGLILLALALFLAELALGPVRIAPGEILRALTGAADPATVAILGAIRLPRALLGLAVGTALGLAGAATQGILRNPLADPGLIGVTGGAALGAVSILVLGGPLAGGLPEAARPWLLPAAAFLGAGVVTLFVFTVARRGGVTSVATLILAGVAVNALVGAVIGMLAYVSDDRQLRDLTFWTMGSLGGAGWPLVLVALAIAFATGVALLAFARALDLFQLGERAAFHSGLDIERAKLWIGVLTALGVGAVTAAAGPIGFVGLIAPHMARAMVGHGHRAMLPAAALTGIALVLSADLAVRLAVPPAEPPIGLAMSLIGGPFFLWLLTRRMRGEGL